MDVPAFPLLLGVETACDDLPIAVITRGGIGALAIHRQLHWDVLSGVRPLDGHLPPVSPLTVIAALAPRIHRVSSGSGAIEEGDGKGEIGDDGNLGTHDAQGDVGD